MNNITFYNSFAHVCYKMATKFRHTDNSQGINCHFLAKMRCGRVKIKTEDQVVWVEQGEYFYLPKGIKYHSYWYGDKDSRLEWESIRFDALPINDNVVYKAQKIEPTKTETEIFDSICVDTINCVWVSNLYSLLGSILPRMSKEKQDEVLALIEDICNFVAEHDDFKVKELALFCSMSESGLFAFMKKHLKVSPIELKNKYKAQKAVELLQSTSMSIEEISTSLGLGSAAYLRKIMKKHIDKTPMQVRKSAKLI